MTETTTATEVWTFYKVRLKKFPSQAAEWVLVITSVLDLINYSMLTNGSRAQKAFRNHVAEKTGKEHYTDMLALVSNLRGGVRGQSFARAMADLLTEVMENQMRLLQEGKWLYIKSTGGYSFDNPDDPTYEVLDSKLEATPVFPAQEVRYLQWPSGTHWYAKQGDVDIEWEGKSKWDTRAEAEAAAKAWRNSVGLSSRSFR